MTGSSLYAYLYCHICVYYSVLPWLWLHFVYSQSLGMWMDPWANRGKENRKDRGRRRRRGVWEHSPLQPVHQFRDTHISQCPIKCDIKHPHTHQHTQTHKTPSVWTRSARHTLQGPPRPSGEWRRLNTRTGISWCVRLYFDNSLWINCTLCLPLSGAQFLLQLIAPTVKKRREGGETLGLTQENKRGTEGGGHWGQTGEGDRNDIINSIKTNICN